MARRPIRPLHSGDRTHPASVWAARPKRTTVWRSRLRYWAALCALTLVALVPLAGTRSISTWTGDFHHAACVGPCCLVTDGFFELSCGEYPPPVRTTMFGGAGTSGSDNAP
jgi:hypothetical protein